MIKSTLGQMVEGQKVLTIGPEETVRSACIAMTSANVGALPVVGPDNVLIGMISERDVIKRSIIVYRPSETTQVRQVMTPNPKWLPPEARPEDALQMMAKGGFRHLPVCREGIIMGIVSIRDFTQKNSSLLGWLRGKSGKPAVVRA